MKKTIAMLTLALLASVTPVHAAGLDAGQLPAAKQTSLGKYLLAREAYEIKTHDPAKVLFVDVRTPAEIEYVGMAEQVDINIPYLLDDYSSWDSKKGRFLMTPNAAFQLKLESTLKARGLDRDSTILLMCRSGDRSAVATNFLAKLGYSNVYTVVEGFEGDMAKEGANKGQRVVNGWKNSGLPWSYALSKEKMYLEF